MNGKFITLFHYTCNLPFLGRTKDPVLARSIPESLRFSDFPIPTACLMSKGNVT